MTNSVTGFGNIPEATVWNGTHGLHRDLLQAALNELGQETITDLRAAEQIEIAAQALRNNGGQGQKFIYVVAHSQGTEVFYRALNFLSAQTRAMIIYYGVGSERFIPNDMGLALAENYFWSDDMVPVLTNQTILRRFTAPFHQYDIWRMPGIGLLGIAAHWWEANYQFLFNNPNGNGVNFAPWGSRRLVYGGMNPLFPFLDLRLNRP